MIGVSSLLSSEIGTETGGLLPTEDATPSFNPVAGHSITGVQVSETLEEVVSEVGVWGSGREPIGP